MTKYNSYRGKVALDRDLCLEVLKSRVVFMVLEIELREDRVKINLIITNFYIDKCGKKSINTTNYDKDIEKIMIYFEKLSYKSNEIKKRGDCKKWKT